MSNSWEIESLLEQKNTQKGVLTFSRVFILNIVSTPKYLIIFFFTTPASKPAFHIKRYQDIHHQQQWDYDINKIKM